MADGYRTVSVYIQGIPAGVLSETEDGYEFRYRDEYLERKDAVAVSLTMPLSDSPFRSTVLFPFFDGLIPEGWLLGLVNRNWKIDYQDRFGLLMVSCRDCIGDVSIREAEDI